jgi:hypothetical protein
MVGLLLSSGLSSFYSELMKGLGAGGRLWELLERRPQLPFNGGFELGLFFTGIEQSFGQSGLPCPVPFRRSHKPVVHVTQQGQVANERGESKDGPQSSPCCGSMS